MSRSDRLSPHARMPPAPAASHAARRLSPSLHPSRRPAALPRSSRPSCTRTRAGREVGAVSATRHAHARC
eukprot:386482-Hanusia_phi.AAC.1